MSLYASFNGTLGTTTIPRRPEILTLQHEKVRLGNVCYIKAEHKGLIAAVDAKIYRIERYLKREESGQTRVLFGDPIMLGSDYVRELEGKVDWKDKRRRKLDRGRGGQTITISSESTSRAPWYANVIVPAGATNAQDYIKQAIDMLGPAGGRIVLLEGNYYIDGWTDYVKEFTSHILTGVSIPSNVSIEGQGETTKIIIHESMEDKFRAFGDIENPEGGVVFYIFRNTLAPEWEVPESEYETSISLNNLSISGVAVWEREFPELEFVNLYALFFRNLRNLTGEKIWIMGVDYAVYVRYSTTCTLRDVITQEHIWISDSNLCEIVNSQARRLDFRNTNDCKAIGGSYGQVSFLSTVKNILMGANIEQKAVGSGVEVFGSLVHPAIDNKIDGNIIEQVEVRGSSVIAGIWVGGYGGETDTYGTIVQNNIVRGKSPGLQDYGVYIGETADSTWISQNDITGSGVYVLIDNGTNSKISENKGLD